MVPGPHGSHTREGPPRQADRAHHTVRLDEKTQRAVSRSAPYSVGDTDNASDGIFNEALVLATRPEGDGYLGAISVDVDRA